LWGVRTFSPAVPPGTYSVRLTANGATQTVPLTVQRNPWITDVTDADLQAQYDFGRSVRDKVTEANSAVISVRNMKVQLENRLERSDDRRLREAGARLDGSASEVEANIYQVQNQAGQDPLNFPIKVNNRLANLMSMSERGDGRPGNNMPVIFDILVEELQGYTDRLDIIWSEELAAVNAILGGLDLPAIDPNCAQPEGCMVM
ncbi:MAG: glycosyl hydrolase, partial [Longimicrobiales bacterium]